MTCPRTAQTDRAVATHVLRERVLALSWGSALLLHVADPRIAQGVADHSVFLNHPARRTARLYSTANTMLDLLVGAPRDARRAAARINAIHDRVHGSTHESDVNGRPPQPYSAHDPALLNWVHVAVHATLLRAFAMLVGPLSGAAQDQYCREVAAIEPLLGIPPGSLPENTRGLYAAFEAGLPALAVGENARHIARGILSPRFPGKFAPLGPVTSLCTIGFLPASVRSAYAMRWTPTDARRFRGLIRLIRLMLPRVPPRLRFVPPQLMQRWETPAE